MPLYNLSFDNSFSHQLDQFALLACQNYNLGNRNKWFDHFRGGLYGYHSRLAGMEKHYGTIHNWYPLSSIQELEYHVASFLFNADSALECFVYALNALGNSVRPDAFFNVEDPAALRKISPRNIIGDKNKKNRPGYNEYFPSVKKEWEGEQKLIKTIVDLHDVSKHRRTVYKGGQVRSDVPRDFQKKTGIFDRLNLILFSPQKEVLLMPNPKENQQLPLERKNLTLLEDIGPAVCSFINKISRLAVLDSKETIKLNEETFLRS